jgi:hypothetical protein
MSLLWLVAPCRLYCLHRSGDDGESAGLWKFGKLVPICTALQPRRQPSSYLPPSESEFITNTVLDYWMVKYFKERINFYSVKEALGQFLLPGFHTIRVPCVLFSISDIRIFHIRILLQCSYYLIVELSTIWSRLCQLQFCPTMISVFISIHISNFLRTVSEFLLP